VNYQRVRTLTFQKLLAEMPFARSKIRAEVLSGPLPIGIEIPPFVRGEVWAALLGVHGRCEAYEAYDKTTEHWGDEQLDKDIPRCHQYHPYLSTPHGRAALRRVLKAWQILNPHLAYWQGLDSLAAPFICLNPTNEGMAFCSLQELVQNHVHDLFLPDNSSELQRRMWHFSMLLVWHDPKLASHLAKMQFQPELYAIPWFLTLFAHVLPLEKTFLLWDALLLHPPTLIIHVALAITRQFRWELLSSGFNGCVMFFSRNVAHVDIEQALLDALWSIRVCPPSIYANAASIQDRDQDRDQDQDVAVNNEVAPDANSPHHSGERMHGGGEISPIITPGAAPTLDSTNLDGQSDPWEVPSTVDEQRSLSYCCPIIFAKDLISQAERGFGTRRSMESVHEEREEGPWSYIAIDVRDRVTYDELHLAGSIHVGWKSHDDGADYPGAMSISNRVSAASASPVGEGSGWGSAQASPTGVGASDQVSNSCYHQLLVTVPRENDDSIPQDGSPMLSSPPMRASSRTVDEEARDAEVATSTQHQP